MTPALGIFIVRLCASVSETTMRLYETPIPTTAFKDALLIPDSIVRLFYSFATYADVVRSLKKRCAIPCNRNFHALGIAEILHQPSGGINMGAS